MAATQSVAMMRADLENAFGASGDSLRKPQQRMIGSDALEDLPPPPTSAQPVSAQPNFVPKPDRRKSERRSMDTMREEALRNVISRVEDRNSGGWRDKMASRRGFKPARLILLGVSLLAGGTAAFLATPSSQPGVMPVAEPITQLVTEVVQEAKIQILVARDTIGVGQRLSPTTVEWANWPEGEVRPEYITLSSAPEAIAEMTGAMARFEIFPGEPIREQKLALTEQGYLSAVLDPGMRGVSVSVSAASASGGFIVPNDHVDVVLTQESGSGKISETILHNVRVLAINSRLGELGETGAEEVEGGEDDPRTEVFAEEAIATLELDPIQAEVIINGATLGKLALVLRSMTDFTEADRSEERAANAAIRITSPFWSNETNSSELQ